MRKGLALFRKRLVLLALALCLLLSYGCSADVGGTSAGEISDYDSVSTLGEFVFSDKMYEFEGNNLVVLNVENKTSKNYTIYIHGQYLDENGKVIKEETKEFRGFEAGWKNNFFFTPGIPFAQFTYKMETKEYTDSCYGSLFSLTYKWKRNNEYDFFRGQAALAEWENNGKSGEPPKFEDYLVDTLLLYINHDYKSGKDLALKESVLFLSSKGEVLRAPDVRRFKMFVGDHTGNDVEVKEIDYPCSYEDNAKLFERFESGDIVVLISIELAKVWDENNRWEW